jgi:hypothetical protein
MKSVHSIAAMTFVALLLGATNTLVMAAPPGPGFYSSDDSRSRDRGQIAGEVVGVDYGRGILFVANHRGRIAVLVLPSTTIYRGRSYATLTDLTNGMRVQIEANEVDGRLIAQIIRIL